MIEVQAVAAQGKLLKSEEIAQAIKVGLGGKFNQQKVLVLIPDQTRSIPLPELFRALVNVLADTSKLDFLVALGTHPPLDAEQMNRLVGITQEEREGLFAKIGLLNHEWSTPSALTQIGTLSQSQIRETAGKSWHPSLGGDVPIMINARIMDYDQILILGPTFPHEVVGFSGGLNIFFQGSRDQK